MLHIPDDYQVPETFPDAAASVARAGAGAIVAHAGLILCTLPLEFGLEAAGSGFVVALHVPYF